MWGRGAGRGARLRRAPRQVGPARPIGIARPWERWSSAGGEPDMRHCAGAAHSSIDSRLSIVDPDCCRCRSSRAGGGTFEGRFIGLVNYGALLADAYFPRGAVGDGVLHGDRRSWSSFCLALGVALLLVHPFDAGASSASCCCCPGRWRRWRTRSSGNGSCHANYGISQHAIDGTRPDRTQRDLAGRRLRGRCTPCWRSTSGNRCRSSPSCSWRAQNMPPVCTVPRALDGANAWQQFLHITLPQLRPTARGRRDPADAVVAAHLRPDLRADQGRPARTARCCSISWPIAHLQLPRSRLRRRHRQRHLRG